MRERVPSTKERTENTTRQQITLLCIPNLHHIDLLTKTWNKTKQIKQVRLSVNQSFWFFPQMWDPGEGLRGMHPPSPLSSFLSFCLTHHTIIKIVKFISLLPIGWLLTWEKLRNNSKLLNDLAKVRKMCVENACQNKDGI